MKIHKYRLRCTTDSVYEYVWAEDSDPVPTLCPTDSAHTVDPAQTTIVQTTGPDQVENVPKVGGSKTDVDGVSGSQEANLWGSLDYVMPEDLHVQGVYAEWLNAQIGDYACIALIHPSGEGNLGAQADSGQADVTVATGLGAFFNPAVGARYMEIWDSSGNLKEVVKISSVAGDVVTLDRNLVATYDTTHLHKARYNGFSPVRGSAGIDGGMRMLNGGTMLLRNEFSVTEVISAGLVLCVRWKTNSTAGTRDLVVNYIFRKPEA